MVYVLVGLGLLLVPFAVHMFMKWEGQNVDEYKYQGRVDECWGCLRPISECTNPKEHHR